MRDIGSQILLTSLVIPDLRDVVDDDDIHLFASEELRIWLGRSSDYLDLIDPSVVDIVNSYEIDAVLEA